MKIAIGADHRGFSHKEFIKQAIADVEWIDVGADNDERSDYPLFAHKVAQSIVDGVVQFGILLCGTGVGMAMTANRYNGVYAALVWNDEVARQSRSHDNANVLVLPSDFVSQQQSISMIHSWLNAEFLGGRYSERVKMIDKK